MILIIDFGSQYNQLIARRVREHQVYCQIEPPGIELGKIRELRPEGIILSGGPASIYETRSPRVDKGIFDLGIPVLGICYGLQFMVDALGGEVIGADKREYGFAELNIGKRRAALCRRGKKDALLDESWRSDRPATEGLQDHRLHGEHGGGRRRGCQAAILRPPVPSGGGPHGRGEKDAGELSLRRLPLQEELDDEVLCPGRRRGDPSRPSATNGSSSAFRAASTLRSRRFCSTRRSAGSSPASLWTTACCVWRSGEGPGPLRGASQDERPFRPGTEASSSTVSKGSPILNGSARSSAGPSSTCSKRRPRKSKGRSSSARGPSTRT